MASNIIVTQIKKTTDSEWYTLPTPMTMTFTTEVIDASTSGRDTNTGIMYRDIVRPDVLTYSCTLPYGITNLQMRDILDIVLSPGFNAKVPNPRTGTFTTTKKFYCATANPEIDIILSETTQPLWLYKEFTFDAIEF